MKYLIYLLPFFFLFTSCSGLKQNIISEEWNLEEYRIIWENHQKIYVYANGDFTVTNKPLDNSKDVVLLYLKEDSKKLKTGNGKLPKDIIENKLSELSLFSPSTAAARPPCCPVRDNKGVLLYYAYGGNDCPYPCKKPLRLPSGTIAQFDCCPPTFMGYFELR